jgi:hypothetical protein
MFADTLSPRIPQGLHLSLAPDLADNVVGRLIKSALIAAQKSKALWSVFPGLRITLYQFLMPIMCAVSIRVSSTVPFCVPTVLESPKMLAAALVSISQNLPSRTSSASQCEVMWTRTNSISKQCVSCDGLRHQVQRAEAQQEDQVHHLQAHRRLQRNRYRRDKREWRMGFLP